MESQCNQRYGQNPRPGTPRHAIQHRRRRHDLAIQDAVAAVNVLAEPLCRDALTERDLAGSQAVPRTVGADRTVRWDGESNRW